MELAILKTLYTFRTKRELQKSLVTLVALGVFITCCISLFLYLPHSWSFRLAATDHRIRIEHQWHPIQNLMELAEKQHSMLLAERTVDIHSAAQAYRLARGRHPPPGFDKWFNFAQKNDAVIIEQLFDQIYHDLTPFWSVAAKDMRQFAQAFDNRISIRNGTAHVATSQAKRTAEWAETWLQLVVSIDSMLPDLDLAINTIEGSRIIMPWNDIEQAVRMQRGTKPWPKHAVSKVYHTKSMPSNDPQAIAITSNRDQADEKSSWDIARLGCTSHSPALRAPASTNPTMLPTGPPDHSFHGYVQNWTLTKDVCQQTTPDGIYKFLVHPLIAFPTTSQLSPLFGGSKLSMSNDIVMPSAADASQSLAKGQINLLKKPERVWDEKITGVVWRGTLNGDRSHEHQQRFLSMLNAKALREAELHPAATDPRLRLVLSSYTKYNNTVTDAKDLATWLGRVADVGFMDSPCDTAVNESKCISTAPKFTAMGMDKQSDYKFLPVIDGDSPDRFLAVLRATSVPIKATVFTSWYDARLIPWLHFVPMDNSFIDMYGILDFFLGNGKAYRGSSGDMVIEGAHDEAAKTIAMEGKWWAEKVLRNEDMRIYVLRLLLEYARLCSDDRDERRYVDDLGD